MIACINCKRKRRCVLIEASIDDGGKWVVQARLPICRKCLYEDYGTLGHYLHEELR